MKNIIFSGVALLAMSSFAVAGGDIAPAQEPAVVVPEAVSPDATGGFYLGLGYGSLSGEETFNFNPGYGNKTINEDTRDFDQLLLQAGYQFNQYVAVEGRYWAGMNDLSDQRFFEDGYLYDTDASLDAWGIYVKPMYPVTPEVDVYALLGYGMTTLSEDVYLLDATVSRDTDLDGFSWGLGLSYTFSDNIIVFADYVSLYDDTVDYNILNASSDFTIDTWNIGVSYKF